MILTSSQVSVAASSGVGKSQHTSFLHTFHNLNPPGAHSTPTHSFRLDFDPFPTVFFFTAALFLSGYVIQQRTLRDLREAIKPSARVAPPAPPKIFLPDRFKQATTELDDGTVVPLEQPPPDNYLVDDRQPKMVVEVRPTQPEGGDAVKKGPGEETEQKPMSRAERRRRIREDLQRLSRETEPMYYRRRLY